MHSFLAIRMVLVSAIVFASVYAEAADEGVISQLADALICKGDPASAVSHWVDKGSNFSAGYAASGFGEGTDYKAIVILRNPLTIGSAKTFAVVSETDNSNSDFGAFTYAAFEGDFEQVVRLLKLQGAQPFTKSSLGRYVSRQAPKTGCPQTIALTPLDKKHFLLGCGWCNGS